ncbi:phospholipase effector Tle1 domain-containing protein [Marinomonas gallaica]|uniref:phospholipase effector Tle1 domain-containing protein n=1 Tax=Marinomonas gallaica TaxID=1806667 RepID=UPI00082E5397|nr:DUF2235 domain-containing protein [Marinomonas gallaica]
MSVLFFHFDGTCNAPSDAYAPPNADESISNVLKSHLLLGGELDNSNGRLSIPSSNRSFYYAGVGTYGSALERWLNAGFAFENADVANILQRALLDFQCHYHVKIEAIVLIGFSRGAALARRFAALINPFVQGAVVIEAVMDTVASIGWPNLDKTQRPTHDVVFEYGCHLPRCVKHALHLVALDEQRLAFRPTLMNHDARVTELWMPGVHSDVGGGFRQDSLADLSFGTIARWLQRTLKSHRTTLYHPVERLPLFNRDSSTYQYWSELLEMTPSVTAPAHYQQRFGHFAKATLAPRRCHVLKGNTPCEKTHPLWHRSVFKRMAQQPYQPVAILQKPALGWCHY